MEIIRPSVFLDKLISQSGVVQLASIEEVGTSGVFFDDLNLDILKVNVGRIPVVVVLDQFPLQVGPVPVLDGERTVGDHIVSASPVLVGLGAVNCLADRHVAATRQEFWQVRRWVF